MAASSPIAYFDVPTLAGAFGGPFFDPTPGRRPLDAVPAPVLAHELCHAWQITTTSRGLHTFFDAWGLMTKRADALRYLAASNNHQLCVGLLGLGRVVDAATEHETVRSVHRLDQREQMVMGGLTLPLDQIASVAVSTAPTPQTVYRCLRRPVNEAEPSSDYFVEANGNSAQLLGLTDLLEGMAAATQAIRIAADEARGIELDPNAALELLPFVPYHVTYSLFLEVAEVEPWTIQGYVEFILLVDSVLIADPWADRAVSLGKSVERGGPSEPPSESTLHTPFALFMELAFAMRDDSTLRLDSLAPPSMAEFQARLLENIPTAHKDGASSTARLLEAIPFVLQALRELVRVPAVVANRWPVNFEHGLMGRARSGGLTPVLSLLVAGPAQLEWHATESLSSLTVGPFPIEDGSVDAEDLFEIQQLSHISGVVEAMTFGRFECPAKSQCRLPRRSSCNGVTDDILPSGRRCPREAATLRVMTDLQIERDVNSPLG